MTFVSTEASEALRWLTANKEWLFSGVGVFVLGAFGALLRRRSTRLPDPSARQSAAPGRADSQDTRPKRTDSIPTTSQTCSVVIGQHRDFPPLVLQGEILAWAEISIDWRVTNPFKFFTHAHDEHPVDALVQKAIGHLRVLLEEHNLSDARRLRPEIALKAKAKMAPLFDERGIVLEAIDIGAVLQPRE